MPSGYFSPPSDQLDPHLFDGDKLKDEVRKPLIDAIVNELTRAGLKHPAFWLSIWLAGSGISYQWDADRGNGDLDVQVGFDYDKFVNHNTELAGVGLHEMSSMVNRYLKQHLWPLMSHATFGGKEYEVTYFWNYEVGTDITPINPYSAYDVLKDAWVVHPPLLPADPRTLYPAEWFSATEEDVKAAQELLQSYTAASEELSYAELGSAAYITALSHRNWAQSQAQSLYDDLHGARAMAFTERGKGYGDYYNFRWQRAKETGVQETLKAIIGHRSAATDIADAHEALETAMTWKLGKRFGG